MQLTQANNNTTMRIAITDLLNGPMPANSTPSNSTPSNPTDPTPSTPKRQKASDLSRGDRI